MNLDNYSIEDLQQELKYRREIKFLEQRRDHIDQILSIAKQYKNDLQEAISISHKERKIVNVDYAPAVKIQELTYL